MGVTVDGVPVELVVCRTGAIRDGARACDGLAGVRGGARAASGGARRARPSTARSDFPGVLPSCARSRSAASRRPSSSSTDIRGDLHCHTTWSDGRASVEEMARSAQERGYEYLAICDHTPAVGAVRGLSADDVRRQGEEIAAANEALAPVPRAPRDRVRHPAGRAARSSRRHPRGARLGAGERARRAANAAAGADEARGGGAAQPVRALSQPSDGPDHQPAPRERTRPAARLRAGPRASESRSRSTACPPASTSAASTSARRSEPECEIVCSTDAHSIARARQHDAVGDDGAARLGHARPGPQHPAAAVAPRPAGCSGLGRAPSAARHVGPPALATGSIRARVENPNQRLAALPAQR